MDFQICKDQTKQRSAYIKTEILRQPALQIQIFKATKQNQHGSAIQSVQSMIQVN